MLDYTGMARHGLHIRYLADAMTEHSPGDVADAMQRRARLHVEATFMQEEETESAWAEISRIEADIRAGTSQAHRLAETLINLETLLEDDTAHDEPSPALGDLVRLTLAQLAAASAKPGQMQRAA